MTRRIPNRSGVSLKPQHYQTVLRESSAVGWPAVGWFEVHPENYMGEGGPPHRYLTAIVERYPLSMHGVGMSLGSADGIDGNHLDALCKLVKRYEPAQVSEHLAWSHFNQRFMNDLLPLPYNDDSLRTVAANIDQVQERLGRTILVENPSSYLSFRDNVFSEPAFLAELCKRTGCGLLLDVNNVYVSACNQDFDADDYLAEIPCEWVGEIHLSGHALQNIDGVDVRIDDHGSAVKTPVWQLFDRALQRLGRRVPVLIEWDADIPAFDVLLGEADKADRIMSSTFLAHSTAVA